MVNLSDHEQTIYMLMACTFGCESKDVDIIQLASKWMPKNAARSALSSLADKDLIKFRKGSYYYSGENTYILSSGQLFPALRLMLKPENAGKMKSIRSAVSKKREYYRAEEKVDYAIALLAPANTECQYLSYLPEPRFVDELLAVFLLPDYQYIFKALPDNILRMLVRVRLCEALENDEAIDWEMLRKTVIDDREDINDYGVKADLQTCFNLYYYLATGKNCIDLAKAPVDVNALVTAAIQKLYDKDVATAYKLFTKAITLNNKFAREKGVFEQSFLNYYYIICLLLSDTAAAQRKLDGMANKTPFRSPDGLLFKPVYTYFLKHANPKIDKRSLDDNMSIGFEKGVLWLTWMAYTRLGIWPSDVHEPSLTQWPPKAAWLKAELMPTGYIPKNDADAKLFGSSLFYRLNVKPVWEMRLEAIIDQNTPQNVAKADKDKSTRLIYLLEFQQIVPILQKRLKSGAWSMGRRMSAGAFKRLKDSEVELDDTDRKLMGGLEEWDYSIYLTTNIQNLVGCDHVFTGSQSDLIPVSVHEDKPFLIIDKEKDGSFSISTNVDELRRESDARSVYFRKNSDTDYSVYRPSSFERKVYNQILAEKKYPKEAEPLLMKLIAAIGGKTEIHSNMVVDLDDLEKVDGSTKLTLRCVPDRYDSYNISVSVHAFPGLAFVPGKGNIMTVAEKDGKKVQVVRHLKTERHNLKQFSLMLSDLGVLDDDYEFQPDSITDSITVGIGAFLDIMQWVKENADNYEMEWPEGTRVKYHPAVKASAANIGFKAKNGWFDVEGDIQIDENEVISLQKLLQLMHDSGKSRYIKIGESEYVTLSSELSRILKRLDTVTSERRNHLQMSNAAVRLIGDVLDNGDANVTHSKVMDELRDRIRKSADIEPQVPAALHATMRDYQEEGFEWMERVTSWGGGVCLADDMGLGKTLQTIAVLLDKESEGPSLVVAPASVVPNWRNELQKFAPTLSVTILNSAEDREEAIKEAKAGDIVVSTYALLNIQQEQLSEKEWNLVCLDEAHTIKNPNTKMSKAAMSLQAKRKIILTGTPIQNHLSELWNLFQFINPGLLGSAEQFGKKFIEPIEVKHDKERQNQLRKLISPFLLRRTKGEVIEELPEKNEITVPVELSPDEMTMYEVRRREAEQSVLADENVKISTLAEITKLRQMACSVSLVDKKWKRPSSKVEAFIDLAENLNDSGNRALVFSQFTSFFDQVRAAMDKAKLPYLYLDGSTPMAQREKLVKDFQTGKCPFFLISLKAGGLGLNLTGANYVIHLDPWWNPAIEQQATDRAYRIGQKQDVTVYHLISQHTIEEKIQRLHKTKRDLADSLLEGTDMSHALTQEELLELLS